MGKKRSSGGGGGGSRTEKPPAIDKLFIPAIGIALAFMGYYYLKGMDAEIPRVDVEDELALKEVFFGEGAENKNFAGLCHAPPNAGGSVSIPISSVFQDAKNEGGFNNMDFVLIDCQYVLPTSGKTIADRFGLDLTKRPTVFVSGKIGPPKQIPLKHLKTGHMLSKLLKQMTEPHATKIESTKDLKTKCLNKPHCALLLKGGKPEPYVKEAFGNLVSKYHNEIQFASIDSTVLLLSNLEEYLPEYIAGQHRFVHFRKVSGGLDIASTSSSSSDSTNDNDGDGGTDKQQQQKKNNNDTTKSEGRLITSIAPLSSSNGLSFSTMNTLLTDVINGNTNMKKLPALPIVKTRTKKLEQAERQKRQRRLEQQERQKQKQQQGSSSSSSSFSSSDNDGTKEGRKAERERRRQEHRKQNNVREKTPEEIAEMERRRRQRMEEEAAKWNIAPEDAPPEGDPMDDDDEEEYVLDDEDGEEEWVVEDSEDDEDVLDLD